MRLWLRSLAAGCLLIVPATTVSATPIKYTLTGVVGSVDAALASPSFSAGQTGALTMTVDSVPTQTGSDYAFYPLLSASFVLPSYSATATSGTATVVNNRVYSASDVEDLFLGNFPATGPAVNGFALDNVQFYYQRRGVPPINALTSLALPSAPELGNLNGAFLLLQFEGFRNVQFRPTALAVESLAAPEPATLLLFGTGLAAAGVRRYRQRTGSSAHS